jgi:hypothetical protein
MGGRWKWEDGSWKWEDGSGKTEVGRRAEGIPTGEVRSRKTPACRQVGKLEIGNTVCLTCNLQPATCNLQPATCNFFVIHLFINIFKYGKQINRKTAQSGNSSGD